jgi:hypothetical protein
MPIATHGHGREHPRRHGKLPVLEAFIILGIGSMLAVAAIVYSSTEHGVQEQELRQRSELNTLRSQLRSNN